MMRTLYEDEFLSLMKSASLPIPPSSTRSCSSSSLGYFGELASASYFAAHLKVSGLEVPAMNLMLSSASCVELEAEWAFFLCVKTNIHMPRRELAQIGRAATTWTFDSTIGSI